MKKIVLLIIFVCFCSLPAYGAFPTTGTDQTNYCFTPPYLSQNVKPNINLVIDFSGSMQFPAYLTCASWGGYDSSKVADCGSYSNPDSSFRYSTARSYYGNFKDDLYYRYNSTGGYFEENSTCTTTDKKGTIGSNCLSGNLLNWIGTTRTDVIRRILTGGRVKSATTDILESEGSRYTITDTNLKCKFTVSATSTLTRKIKVEDSNGTCAIGTFNDYNMDVKISNPTEYITGIVQSMYPGQVDLELSVYNTTVGVNYRVGKNKALTYYTSAINSELAYNGTPTGEALREAQYYFKQSNSMTATGETDVIGVGNSTKDPYYETGDLPAPCKKSFVLLLSDGVWNGSVDPASIAYDMHTNDMRTDTALSPDKQTVSIYAVYAFGDGTEGRNALIATAMFGGFEDKYGAHSATSTTTAANGWPYPFTAKPNNDDSKSTKTTGNTVPAALAVCNPAGTWHAECAEWDKDKIGLPYNFFEGNDGAEIQVALIKAVNDILSRSSSGTAASMLGNSDSSGAVMLQALFFPERQFSNATKAQWLGDVQAFWYYVDPSLNSAKLTLREDTVIDNKLKLSQDRIAQFVFNGTETKINLYEDLNADGNPDSTTFVEENTDEVKALWRAGLSLWSRLPASSGTRMVYTNNLAGTATSNNMMSFNTSNLSLIKTKLDVASADTDATNVINYTLGVDPSNDNLASGEKDAALTGYRSRTVTIGSSTHVWKLGDIINSTPKMISPAALNSYNTVPPGGYNDSSYGKFTATLSYKNRGAAFVGSNDGMLHAFKLGKNIPGSVGYVSQLVDSTDINGKDIVAASELGEELWAYIPQNVLPYLKHRGNPTYAHMYYVDTTPTVIDASIAVVTKVCSDDSLKGCSVNSDCTSPTATCNSISPVCTGSNCPKIDKSWRTVLIGSMGLGGATRNSTDTTCTNCVKTPIDGVGYSSYFALDVTDQAAPVLLWEFSSPRLGYSTVGPAVVRIKDSTDTGSPQKNGKYYVVLASGPTGPVDTGIKQMKGFSDQSLALFVLDMRTGEVVQTFSNDATAIISGVPHLQQSAMPSLAFGGTFSNSTIDTDKRDISRSGNYSDDAVYLGYVRKDVTTGSASINKFSKGGVLRILTGDDPAPSNWRVSKVIDGIGPVTSAVSKLQDTYNKKLWLYFGTGRYYYKNGSAVDEDFTGQNEAIYGIQDPCYISNTANANVNDLDPACSTTVLASAITDQTSTIGTVGTAGWKINLGVASGDYKAKRVYTNPTTTGNGVVFFTAFKPSSAVCSYGGDSSIWAVGYNTGGSVVGKNLKGQAMLQLATGELKQVDLSSAFTTANGGQSLERETASFKGPPSRDETQITSNANHFPSKKILHIMER